MTKLIFFILIFLFAAGSAYGFDGDTDNNGAIDAAFGGTNATSHNLFMNADTFGVGAPNANEQTAQAETKWIKNAAGEVIVGGQKKIYFADETNGTEDTFWLNTIRYAGAELVIQYIGPPLAAEPALWTPAPGCTAFADRANWDPGSLGSGGAYAVWYDGDSWEVINAQAD